MVTLTGAESGTINIGRFIQSVIPRPTGFHGVGLRNREIALGALGIRVDPTQLTEFLPGPAGFQSMVTERMVLKVSFRLRNIKPVYASGLHYHA